MSGRSAFAGGRRAVWAITSLTTREFWRNGSLGLIALLYLAYLGFFTTPSALSTRAAAARFLDHALGGLSVLMIMAGIFLALHGHAGERRAQDELSRAGRIVGPAQLYWGRLAGLSALLVLLSLLLSGLALVHYAVRFGDSTGELYPVFQQVTSRTFASPNQPLYARSVGDSVELDFDFDCARVARETGVDVILARFAPKLVIATESAPMRSHYPVRIRFRDAEGDWEYRKLVRILEGRPRRFEVPLPPRHRPRKLHVSVEQIRPEYLVKLYRDDLLLIGRPDPLFASVLKAALVMGLYASVFCAVALFIVGHMSYGTGLLVGAGLAVLMSSLDVLELSLLHDVPGLLRTVLLEGARTVLPDYDAYDVVDLLSRQAAVGWRGAAELGARLAGTALLLGLVDDVIDRRSGGR